LAKDLVQKFKFAHQRAAAEIISDTVANTFVAQNSDEQIASKDYVLVPLPTASRRMRQRSFDHTCLLTQKLSKLLGIDMKIILGRLGQIQQVGANRHLRAAQTKNMYYVKNIKMVIGRNILLVDDVVTTGATLSEAAKALRKAGARSVDGLVFAKRL
jgi:ComF family protein